MGSALTVRTHLNDNVNGSTDGNAFTGSVEAGFPVAFGYGLTLEPHAQLVSQWLSPAKFNEGVPDITWNNGNTFPGRIGSAAAMVFEERNMHTIDRAAILDLRRGLLAVVFTLLALLAACSGGHVSQSGGGQPTPDLLTAQILTIEPGEPATSVPVSFYGTGTGTGIRYAWQFGDGASASGQQVTHAYQSAGSFAVTLTVIDQQGNTATSTSTVAVSSQASPPSPPMIALISRIPANPGNPLSLRAISTDVDGGPLTYAWNFGDGQTATGSGTQHTYGAVGTYPVSVTATNAAGLSAVGTTTITIVAAPVDPMDPPLMPTISAPDDIRAQRVVQFTGNAQPPANGSVLSYTWDFGDGSPAQSGQSIAHTYSSAGLHTVTLVVTDSLGRTGTATAAVAVLPLQPPHSVVIHGPLEVVLGRAAAFSAEFDNPVGGTVTYAWDFGDGSTSTDAFPSHTYLTAGQYTVKLAITDPLAGSGSASMTLNVVKDDLTDLPCAGTSPGTGWCNAPSLPIGPTALNTVSFADPRSGWIGGENGGLIHSNDGGLTWTVQIASGNAIVSISSVDGNHVWALDKQRNVLASSDAGATWLTVATGAGFSLNAVRFADQRHGWVVGQGQSIFATTDGGQTWTSQFRNSSAAALNAIDVIDANHAFAVGDDGAILQTTDGGQSWSVAFAASGTALKSISFGDASTGFTVGRGGSTLYRTTDGGATWTALTPPPGGALLAVRFVTPSIGWVVTESGSIYRTDDSGVSWRVQTLPSQTLGLPSLDAVNATNSWLVTAGGAYFVTGTGGDPS
ncbi:hypothetical protein WJ74_33390 [Burkholderia ubonensis]|uniref:PKD domain-containing protein n=1 Tax=Burkholderia ubonensis TaxID=101571 RepID=UPI00075EEAB9|nr:PKD domain-containing protein [Burkholderia ubonensis]KVO23659.1 hypothetical protein WJ74_33390 [Burkholderia ubonensis]